MAPPTGGGTPARHAEASAELVASQRELFDFLDDHRTLSSHMESSRSPMMAGGTVRLILDEQQGRAKGDHVVMRGTVLGLELFVDEIVVERVPPEPR